MVNKVVSVSGRGRAIAQAVSRSERIKLLALESARQALGYRFQVCAWSEGRETVCSYARLPRAKRSFALRCARHYDLVILVDTETGELLDSFENK